jgi:hypothetical protein
MALMDDQTTFRLAEHKIDYLGEIVDKRRT